MELDIYSSLGSSWLIGLSWQLVFVSQLEGHAWTQNTSCLKWELDISKPNCRDLESEGRVCLKRLHLVPCSEERTTVMLMRWCIGLINGSDKCSRSLRVGRKTLFDSHLFEIFIHHVVLVRWMWPTCWVRVFLRTSLCRNLHLIYMGDFGSVSVFGTVNMFHCWTSITKCCFVWFFHVILTECETIRFPTSNSGSGLPFLKPFGIKD